MPPFFREIVNAIGTQKKFLFLGAYRFSVG